MVTMSLSKRISRFVLASALVAAACAATLPAQAQSVARPAAARTGIYLGSLQMTSASTGWALRWTRNPNVPTPTYLVPARTTNDARTWTTVTPPGAPALLSTPYATVVLHALNGDRAWLAVTEATAATMFGTAVHTTVVYVTANGGRTWRASAALKVQGFAEFLSLSGSRYGWLLEDLGSAVAPGAAMDVDYVVLYRTTDGGLRWSRAAEVVPPQQSGYSRSGLPVMCDKAGLELASPTTGWLLGDCNKLAWAARVSRDGGVKFSTQALPIPASACTRDGCFMFGPQFIGQTGFLTIGRAPAAPFFLISHNLGLTWKRGSVPSGGGDYPRIQFFTPSDGILVSEGPQGAIGHVFYTTGNGGSTWAAVPQGRSFTQLGVGFDFVSVRVGYAWILGADAPGSSAPQMYRTTNSGRTWEAFEPVT